MHVRKNSWSADKTEKEREMEKGSRTERSLAGSAKTVVEEDDSLNIATFKIFLHKKLQSASSLIMKPKTHTFKVRVVTNDDSIELVVADGTFFNQVQHAYYNYLCTRQTFHVVHCIIICR